MDSITQVREEDKAHGTDLTKNSNFEQGDNCFVWYHPILKVEVEVRFRFYTGWRGWKVRCLKLGIETQFDPQSHDDLAEAIESWIDQFLKRADPDPQPKTIWEILVEKIEAEDINLWPNERETLWESKSGQTKVDIFCNRTRQLMLVAVNGKMTISKPLAINPKTAPAYDWRLTTNAHQKYQIWVKQVTQ